MHQIIDSRTKAGYIVGWASIVLNVVLFAFKFYAGKISGSVAMQADAWHTLSDSLTSIVVIFGFWLASRPADKRHPYGHGRAESIGALVIAVMLAIVGINFLIESAIRLRGLHQPMFTYDAVIIFLISVLAKEIMAQVSIFAGKKINSQALVADGWHHRSDALASALIVIGAVYGGSLRWFDGAMGIIVAALIIYAAFKVFKTSADNLLGKRISPKLKEEISETVHLLSPAASDVHNFKLHTYGEHKEVTFHIRLPEKMSVRDAHETADMIENALFNKFNIHATVHIEPYVEDSGGDSDEHL